MSCVKENQNVKRKKKVRFVLFISMAYLLVLIEACLPTYAAEKSYRLAETETDQKEDETAEEKTERIQSAVGDEEKTQEKSLTTEEAGDKSDIVTEENVSEAEDGIEEEGVPFRLQVPQRFDIVMDPWEVDEKGQIYSEEYTIKNISKERGMLRLTGIAVGNEEGVNVLSDGDGIHIGNGRNIFVEMIINNDDKYSLLPEGSDYEIILGADEDVTLAFTGKMNENAESGWHDSDVMITVIYDWLPESEEGAEMEDAVPEENGTEEGKNPDTGMLEDSDGRKENLTNTDMLNEGRETDTDATEGGGENKKISDADTSEDGGKEDEKHSDVDIPEDGGEEDEKPSDADTPEDNRGEEKISDMDTLEIDRERKAPDMDVLKENGSEEEKSSGVGAEKENGMEELNRKAEDGNK